MALENTVVINLDKDYKRLEWMQKQLAGVTFRRFEAITPDTIPQDIRERFPPDGQRLALSPTEQACFASHLAVCLQLLSSSASEDSHWMICEDDIALNPAFLTALISLPWHLAGDIIRLNEYPKAPTLPIEEFGGIYKLIRYSRIPNGAGAYLINKSGARKICAAARQIDVPFDIFLRWTWINKLEVTGVFPPPVSQDEFGQSSIGDPTIRSGRTRSYTLDSYSFLKREYLRLAHNLRLQFKFKGRLPFEILSMKLKKRKRGLTKT